MPVRFANLIKEAIPRKASVKAIDFKGGIMQSTLLLVLIASAAVILLLVTVKRVFVKRQLVSNLQQKLKFPGELNYRELAESELSEEGRAFYLELDEKLNVLYFEPAKTFTLLGYARSPENRLYCNPTEGINLMATFVGSSAGAPAKTIYEFRSRFTDGSTAATSNMAPQGQVFPSPDYEVVQRFPGQNDPAELFKHQKKMVEKKRGANLVPVYIGPEEVMDEMKKSAKRRMEYFVQKGWATFDPVEKVYRPTVKMVANLPIKPHVSVKVNTNKK
jgi:hypothetical protein